ncbi:MAG: hypothetical protein AAGD32_18135 [Planctomycetota bacterium]
MKDLLARTLRDVAAEGTAGEVAYAIRKLLACDSPAAVATVVCGLTLGTAAPVLIPALLLVGLHLLTARGERKQAESFDEHCNDVLAQLDTLRTGVRTAAEVADDVSALIERRTWVWAKIDGREIHLIAQRVRDEIVTTLDNAGFAAHADNARVYFETILAEFDKLHERHDDTQEKIDDAVRQVLAAIEANKQPGVDPTQTVYPPEVIKAAQLLMERGDKEQRALAETIARRHDEADRLLDELLADPLAETVRLLTRKGDNWYAAGEFDKAIEPYEQVFALCPDDLTARNNVTRAHGQARLGDVTEHGQRAIEVATGTLELVQAGSPDWAMTQNNLGVV